MKCTHVLGLIDAGPFADFPRDHLEAAWQHARSCATCGPALDASTAITDELRTIAQPVGSPNLAASVMARVQAIHAERQARDTRTAPIKENAAPRWAAWATVSGLAAILFVTLPNYAASPAEIAMRSSSLASGALWVPQTVPGMLLLVLGLGAYLRGLFGVAERGKLRAG